MPARWLGPIDWGLRKDDEGTRDYYLKSKVETTSTREGPAVVELCPGLPQVGSIWGFPWALSYERNEDVYCTPEMTISKIPSDGDEPSKLWIVDQTFSNRITEGERLENPLLEPAKWSGSFVNRTESRTDLIAFTVELDEFGNEIFISRTLEVNTSGGPDVTGILMYRGPVNTSWEPITGKVTEFDSGGPTVEVEMNLLELPLHSLAVAYKTVNIAPMWGLPARTIKLQNISWSRKTWNSNVTFYYTVKYEFEVNYRTWDRYALNQGTRCLIGNSPGTAFKGNKFSDPLFPDLTLPVSPDGNRYPGYRNLKNFEIYKDKAGENTTESVLLDEYGRPIDIRERPSLYQKLMYYRGSDFLLLGIPPVIPTGSMP